MLLQAQFILQEENDFNVGQLVNHDTVRQMTSDDQIFSLKGTLLNFFCN